MVLETCHFFSLAFLTEKIEVEIFIREIYAIYNSSNFFITGGVHKKISLYFTDNIKHKINTLLEFKFPPDLSDASSTA